MRQKYGNKKTGKYASKKEAAHATVLYALQKSGKITDLKEQVKFILIPSQYIEGKCVERSCSYVSDFTFLNESGKLIVQDVKGFRTEIFKIKKKLMLFIHHIIVECV